MHKKNRFVQRFALFSTFLAALALVAMLLISVADVTMANLFNRPIIGAFDLVETTLVLVVFLGLPATFLSGGHIAVDVVDFFVSADVVRWLKVSGKVLSFFFLAFLAWQMFTPAHDAYLFGERKQELGLPLFILWIPMLFGVALSAAMALFSISHEEASSSTAKE